MLSNVGLWLPGPPFTYRMEHYARRSATHFVVDDDWCFRWLPPCGSDVDMADKTALYLGGLSLVRCFKRDHDGYNQSWWYLHR